jgi:hypothetical protein
MASIKLSALISRLRDEGITRVYINYDGSGDSGSISDIDFEPFRYGTDEYVKANEMFSGELEDFGYHILNNHYNWDWYNNDGGYGNVSIDVEDSTVSVNGYVRTTEEAYESVNIEDLDY